jgi:hypothetical protein
MTAIAIPRGSREGVEDMVILKFNSRGMELEQAAKLVEDVNFTIECMENCEGMDRELLVKEAIKIVDKAYQEAGEKGVLPRTQLEEQLLKGCIVEQGKAGPDLYVYTCYTGPDPNDSNTAGFTEHQLDEFAKSHAGIPVRLNHHNIPVGVTLVGGRNKKGDMMGGFVFYDTEEGRAVKSLMDKGFLRAVSLGARHLPQKIDGVTHYTHAGIEEVSVVALGDIKGTEVHGKIPWEQRMNTHFEPGDLKW